MLHASLWMIPAFPLLGAVLAYLVGRVNRDLSGWIATLASIAALAATIRFFQMIGAEGVIEDKVFTWFSVTQTTGSNMAAGPNMSVDFAFRFDQLTAVMCLVVTGIGSLIHLYSIAYMAEDDSRPRFFSYLNLFMFSMLCLVLAANLVVLFVGWEGVGLCSYLLIGFWFKNINFAAAGRKAFVVNRIGDAGFLLGIFLLWYSYGTLDFRVLSNAIATSPLSTSQFNLIAFCFFVGAAGKSAQIPLFVWLPDAMAGPTPVSALIHAATMVTAGIYMMARLHFVFDLAPYTMSLIAWIAAATAFVAGTTALVQNDIKKVLAYSTVSQLGFMFMAASVGAYWVALFHVVTHAFFKACLFLGAGSVIHGCHHEQDMRKMGGLLTRMPITAVTYLISTLAIAGIAPFAGYYSKHAILTAVAHTDNSFLLQPFLFGNAATIIGFVASFTAFCTAFYMTRSFALTFLGDYRGATHGHDHHHTASHSHADDNVPHHNHDRHNSHERVQEPHESPWAMTVPLIILAVLALTGGYLLEHHFSLQEYVSPILPSASDEHRELFAEALVNSWLGILGVVVGLVLYTQLASLPLKFYNAVKPVGALLTNKYYVDELYRFFLVGPLENISRFLWKGVDQGLIDGSVNATAALVDITGEVTRLTQTGQVRHYALFMFIGTIVIVFFYMVL